MLWKGKGRQQFVNFVSMFAIVLHCSVFGLHFNVKRQADPVASLVKVFPVNQSRKAKFDRWTELVRVSYPKVTTVIQFHLQTKDISLFGKSEAYRPEAPKWG